MAEIKEHIRSMANAYKDNCTAADGGVLVEKEKGVVVRKALEIAGIEEKTYKQVLGFHGDLLAGMTLGAGEMAEKVLSKDKKLDNVSGSIDLMNQGSMKFGYQRKVTRMVRNPADPSQPARESTTYGAVTNNMSFRASKNSGQLKVVRTALSESAMKLFK